MSLAESLNATIVREVLKMRATVYSRTNNTGAHNLVVRADLPCLLQPVNRQPAATGAGRRELAAMGTLRYDAAFSMPTPLNSVQIEVDAFPGVRWNPSPATEWPDYAPGIGTVGKTVDVTRAS